MIPEKLKKGDEVRVISPSRSMAIISPENRDIARKRLEDELGLKITFSKHVEEKGDFSSSSIEFRVDDLHEAFRDKNVKAILTTIGGFNSNQLLTYLNYKLIKSNPKIFCGYSDITALSNAIYAKTELVTYYGPHFSTFGMRLGIDYTTDHFKKCLMSDSTFEITPSDEWSDDFWYVNQNKRDFVKNDGYFIINKGKAEGVILGGNLCTFNLLQGTEYFPKFARDTILFFEDDDFGGKLSDVEFDRNLQSVIHLEGFKNVKGLVIGRFQKASNMTNDKIFKIVKSKKELDKIPVIANVDFGHTSPMTTYPIGGDAKLDIGVSAKLMITKH